MNNVVLWDLSDPVLSIQQQNKKATQETLQMMPRRKMENAASLEMVKTPCCSQRRNRHRGPSSSAVAILLIAIACIQNPCLHEVVHAYSPSMGIVSRTRHRGAFPTPSYQRCQSSQSGAKTSLRKYSWNTLALFGATNDGIEGGANEVHDESFHQDTTSSVSETKSKIDDEKVFDNLLLPSTMTSSTVNSRMVKRRATGLSSSVLLPLSESTPSQQMQPLFQTNNNPTSEYDTTTKEATTWKERLMDVSNLASLLCVLDCTLLPLVSIAIPALSWGVGFVTGTDALGGATAATSSNSIMAGLSSLLVQLPALSHGIALYFVIPVGLLTTIVNYFFGHREVRFSLLSFVGVALIYVANSSSGVGIPNVDAWLHSMGIVATAHGSHGAHVHDACGAVVGAATGMMAHTCPEGLAHRLTNTLGCAFLLGSNYYSRKYMEDKSQGCAASALAEAWGGGDGAGGRAVCPPGCGCEAPSYGTSSGGSSRTGGEAFFQWEKTPGGKSSEKKGRSFTRFRP